MTPVRCLSCTEVEFEIEEAVANDDKCWTASTSKTKDMSMEVIGL
jgi:hypothetical protein